MPRGPARTVATALLAMLALGGCATGEGDADRSPRAAPTSDVATPTSQPATPRPTSSSPSPSVAESESGPVPSGQQVPGRATRSRPDRVRLSIPAIDIDRLRVVAYRGTADDRPGTHIQDRGHAATPRGPRGGVGPGEVGNFIVTAHRTTAGRPFGKLPRVRNGDHVLVEAGHLVYDYRITRTMTISFRSRRDRARQSAPVPGRLGEVATQPMITLSTCATPEDHAAGNFWADELGNPEHRIDKVGVLVDVRPV
jgi:sortase A